MTARVLVNGADLAHVSVTDRGLLYGDGVFETILFAGGAAPLWERHMRRLAAGCRRLSLPEPDTASVAREAAAVSGDMARAVVRVSVTRGGGARGYAPPLPVVPTRIVAAFEPPFIDPDWYVNGIRVRFGDLRLSVQPRLGGIKHLNRLEQVLARAEWSGDEVAEALLFDMRENLVGATAANVFVALRGELMTPGVDECGIAGVAREEIMAMLPQTKVCTMGREALMQADEIFLCSSVRGILPVRELAGCMFAPGPFARAMQKHWHTQGLMPEPAA